MLSSSRAVVAPGCVGTVEVVVLVEVSWSLGAVCAGLPQGSSCRINEQS